MRTVSRLRLLCFASSPGNNPNPKASALPSCPLAYSLPCRNHDWPIRKHTPLDPRITGRLTGDVGPKRVLTSLLDSEYTFWWTRRESNPRPRHFSFCFIQPYYNTLPMSGAPDYPRKVCARLLRIYALSGK